MTDTKESTEPKEECEDDCDFNYNLVEMTKKSDKEFASFIDKKLYPKKSNLSIEVINKNINCLKEMSSEQQVLVKSRASQFEETSNPSKFFPSILVLVGLVLGLYKMLIDLTGNNEVVVIISLAVNVLLIFYFTREIFSTFKAHTTAVFFNRLIHNICFNNENK